MEILSFTNNRGELRFYVRALIKTKKGFIRRVYNANGCGYSNPDKAVRGYFAEKAKEQKEELLHSWRNFKCTETGIRFIHHLKGKKLTYKLIDEVKLMCNLNFEITTAKLYNIIKAETNKECCYE